MAAFVGSSKKAELSKADYLKRYLSADEGDKKGKKKVKKKRVKVTEKRLKIVDDDIDWKQTANKSDVENEDDDEEAPVIAEMIDERPEEVKQLEAFRTSNKWRILGADEKDLTEEGEELGLSRGPGHDSPECSSRVRSDSPRQDSSDTSPPRRGRHYSPDVSPPRKGRHDSPDASPHRISSGRSQKTHCRDASPVRGPNRSPDSHQPPLTKRAERRHDSDSDQSPPRKKTAKKCKGSDSDQSPPRRRDETGKGHDSDQSPPRRITKHRRGSDSDQSPPRRRKKGEDDLSPPRRPGHSQGPMMLSGGKAGLVSIDILRREQEDNRRREKNNQPLEEESRNAQTVFRDKSGKKRDLDTEREEQKKKAGEKAAKDEKYANWGKGLVQRQMQQQNLEDALVEVDKPLARYRDDEDLDRMLREREREGDPMAAMLRRKKEQSSKQQGAKDKPRYKGPMPPPNRFNIMPGYRWDGVNRSNGFEQKRYTRMADKRALQEEAYKWSVEDM